MFTPVTCSTALADLLLQQFEGELRDVLPGLVHVVGLGAPGADAEAQHEATRQLAGHQVDLSALGDPLQQRLVQLVSALPQNTHQAVS